jgi:hypothetical protein
MYAAHEQSILGDAVLLLIMLSFLIIAAEFWVRLRLTGQAAILKPRLVILAMILAALTGYLPRLVAIDETLLLAMHIALAVLAWGYAIYSLIDLFGRQPPPPSGGR